MISNKLHRAHLLLKEYSGDLDSDFLAEIVHLAFIYVHLPTKPQKMLVYLKQNCWIETFPNLSIIFCPGSCKLLIRHFSAVQFLSRRVKFQTLVLPFTFQLQFFCKLFIMFFSSYLKFVFSRNRCPLTNNDYFEPSRVLYEFHT